VTLDSGKPFRGIVDIVPHGHSRQLPQSYAYTNEAGEFAFSALPPGDYLRGSTWRANHKAARRLLPHILPAQLTDRWRRR
jgi:hypothetical protein